MKETEKLKAQLFSMENLAIGRNSWGELLLQGADKSKIYVLKEKPASEQSQLLSNKRLLSALKKLDYPGLPHIYEIEVEQDTAYILMDYISGTRLRRTIEENWYTDDPMVNGLSLFGFRITLQIMDILEYLHTRNLYYGNMWLDDIIIHEGRAFLTDFADSGFQKHGNKRDSYGMLTDLEELGAIMPMIILPGIRQGDRLTQKQEAVFRVSEKAQQWKYKSIYEMKLELLTLVLQ